jgi:hypothetical protein
MTQTCCPICGQAFRGHGKHPWSLLLPDVEWCCDDCGKPVVELIAEQLVEAREYFKEVTEYQWELKEAHARWLKRMAEYKANKVTA